MRVTKTKKRCLHHSPQRENAGGVATITEDTSWGTCALSPLQLLHPWPLLQSILTFWKQPKSYTQLWCFRERNTANAMWHERGNGGQLFGTAYLCLKILTYCFCLKTLQSLHIFPLGCKRRKLYVMPSMGKGKASTQPCCPYKEQTKRFCRRTRYAKYRKVQISCQSFVSPIQTKSKYFFNKKQTQELW